MKAISQVRWKLIALMSVQSFALLLVAWKTGPGWDEWGHLPSGLYSHQYGDYFPYCVNPPLTRYWCAWPVTVAGGGIEYEPMPRDMPGFRSEWVLQMLYIEQQRDGIFYWMSVARTAAIPIALFGTYLVWLVGKRLFSTPTAWAGAWLWAFSPTVLTFGASITPDVTAAVFGLLAAWRFYIWLRIGGTKHAAWLGLACGLAMLSKASWLILPPILFSTTILYGWMHSRRWRWLPRLKQGAIVAAICWLTIHAMYEFDGTLVPLGRFEFVSEALKGSSADSTEPVLSGNRFRDNWLGCIPAPLPAAYMRGIDIQKRDFESKMESYFFAEWRDHGWWYYYIVGIWLKEPVALWLMALGALTVWAWSKLRVRNRTRVIGRLIVFAPGVVLLIFVSSQTGFNHHLRYVLPFLPCFYLLVAAGVLDAKGWRFTVVGLLAWYAISSLSILPRSYAYFTEVIGGPSEGWKYLGDSNLDWGQDILTAKKWVEANPEKRPVYFLYSLPAIDFRKLGIDADDGKAFVTPSGPARSGWWVAFARPILDPENRWFREHEPTERLSVTTSVFEVSVDDSQNNSGAASLGEPQ